MPTSTVEQYIKQIYTLQQDGDAGRLVALGEVSAAVGVVPGTATTMVKALSESGLLKYEPRHGVRLTPSGEKLALHVLRRHRLIELFLVKVLGFDWSDVHEEADRLEHAISEQLVERIDEFLGRPEYDPHGDPIPTAGGHIQPRLLISLADAKPGVSMVIARISDQDRDFLAYAEARGLTPGTPIVVESIDVPGDMICVQSGRKTVRLGRAAAVKIAVAQSV